MNELPQTTTSSARFIKPKRVRYIKLGRAGRWEKECIADGIIRIGYGTGKPAQFALCHARQWAELTDAFLADQKDKGTATRFTNELRLFFEDVGDTLWITFVGEQLYWCLLTPEPAEIHSDCDGVFRKVAHSWQGKDISGQPLTKDRLSGALSKLSAYRGASCDVDVYDYAVRRINAQKIPEVEIAVTAVSELTKAIIGIVRLLRDKDFEILVELIFSNSGWQRQGATGKTQKTLDLDLLLPSTGERAFVQVKSETTLVELHSYITQLGDLSDFDRMFYVYHSGDISTDDERVILIGPAKLAEMVMEAGLVNWVLRKVS